MAWTSLCSVDDLVEGAGKYVEVGQHQLAVFLDHGKPHVMDNYCPHAGGNMAGGRVEKGCAVCPWHDWAFRLEDGQLRESKFVHIRIYPVRVVDQHGRRVVEAELDRPLIPPRT